MTAPLHLAKPPVTEALIDLRVEEAVAIRQDQLDAIRRKVGPDYPQATEQFRFHASVEAGPGRAPEARAEDLGLQGWILGSADKTQLAQFRSDGFTLNRLRPYTSWEQICPEALRLWSIYVEVMRPTSVARIAVRYINHVRLDGMNVSLSDYLRAPLPMPDGMDLPVTSFLTSVVLSGADAGFSVRVTQSLEPPHLPPDLLLLLDLDASANGRWLPNDQEVAQVLNKLRTMKNEAFFGSLTAKALARYR